MLNVKLRNIRFYKKKNYNANTKNNWKMYEIVHKCKGNTS